MLRRYVEEAYAGPRGNSKRWIEHQKKMAARLKKRRENIQFRKKGRHIATEGIWEYVEVQNPKNYTTIVDLLKKLDVELWRLSPENLEVWR